VELQEAAPDELAKPEAGDEAVAFYAALGEPSVEVSFEDLCTPCRRTIRAVLDQIGKRVKGLSPDRKAEKKPKAPSVAKEKPAAQHAQPAESVHATPGQLFAKASAPTAARAG